MRLKTIMKVSLAVSLALVMLLTTVSPALAKPEKGTLTPFLWGTGTYTLMFNRDNTVKVSVMLRGLPAGQPCSVWVTDVVIDQGLRIFTFNTGYANEQGSYNFVALAL